MSRYLMLVACALLLCPSAAFAQRKGNPAFADVKDDPNLPRVLLIGDSISIGYHVAVRDALKGKANVHRPKTNCGPTTRGLEQIDAWLKTGTEQGEKWDVIHFNWGLHDLKYINDKGGLVDVKDGKQQVSIEDYEKNLRSLVATLKKTGAKLIWCATTPVPEGAKGRVPGDEVKYNAVAAKVMKENDIAIDDLYSFAKPKLSEIQKSKDVHFTPAGSKTLAEEVARHITASLNAK